jgi:hypothetical protein
LAEYPRRFILYAASCPLLQPPDGEVGYAIVVYDFSPRSFLERSYGINQAALENLDFALHFAKFFKGFSKGKSPAYLLNSLRILAIKSFGYF